MERQIPGLRLVHLLSDFQSLRPALLGITEVMEQNRILIVIDNAESLLSADGRWRDDRFALLIDALTGHGGLSRLVITSRRRPAMLPDSMLVEAVHALSLRESVLLARELPHLAALIDGTAPGLTADRAREVAAGVLSVVQGHPKLIELADGLAATPDALAVRLEQTRLAWLEHGTRLDAFLATGESHATDVGFLSVLENWTRSAAASLPEGSGLLLQVLCGMEDGDRERQILTAVWPGLWEGLARGGSAPEPDALVEPLTTQALVVTRDDPGGPERHYGIHPSIADTIRVGTQPATHAAIDAALGDYWLTNLDRALDLEGDQQSGGLVRHAAGAAAPYLLRRRLWTDLGRVVEQLLIRDTSSAAAAAVIPMLAASLDQLDPDDTTTRIALGFIHALATSRLDPRHGESLLRDLLHSAEVTQQWTVARSIVDELIELCVVSGRLDEALTQSDRAADYTRRAGHGLWSQLSDQTRRLHILQAQGRSRQVLDAVEQLHQSMTTLPDRSDPTDGIISPWSVREALLQVGVRAAIDLRHPELALDLHTERRDSMRRRGASPLEQAVAEFSAYGALLQLGRVQEARELLHYCRSTFEASNDIPLLGRTIRALAQVEAALGRHDNAIALVQDALRYEYLAGDPHAIADAHYDLATYLDATHPGLPDIWAHLLAAATVRYQTGDGFLTTSLRTIGRRLTDDPDHAPPTTTTTITAVCAIVEQVPGVHLSDLLTRLPARAPSPQAAMEEVLRLAPDAAAEEAARYVADWDPVLAALHAALLHPDTTTRHQAGEALAAVLASATNSPDWRSLVDVLRRILAGDRDLDALVTGLDQIDTAITRRALDVLAGTVALDLGSWRSLSEE